MVPIWFWFCSENVFIYILIPKEKSPNSTDRGTWMANGNSDDEMMWFQNDLYRSELLLTLVGTNIQGEFRCSQYGV